MRIAAGNKKCRQEGSILAYFIILVIAAVAVASVGTYVTQTTRLSQRRSDMVAAKQFAIGGAVVACADLNSVLTNTSNSSLTAKLMNLANPYQRNSDLSSSSTDVYERIIYSPFTSQAVSAQLWLPTDPSPTTAKIVSTATVRSVSQSATVNVKMGWGYPAAIISVNQGTTATLNDKATAQDGNVTVNGDKSGPIVIDGGTGLAVWANGRFNVDAYYCNPSRSSYSMTNWNTANQVADYTSQGTSNALFDISRFIAVANATPSGYAPSGNNHFTNLATFITAAKTHTTTNPMQGVVVVDVFSGTTTTTDKKGKLVTSNYEDPNLGNLTDANLPKGINIRGTFVMNFIGNGWDPVTEKIIVTADLNVNAADLSHLVATNPATYTTGYPPVYIDPTKNPININIAPAYQNFTAADDLPAELYTIGCLDMHGNANICGVLYTPSYMEIENKNDSQTQYIRGACIMGNGIYYENAKKSTSIISFDPKTVDSLATLGGAGKMVKVTYWE